MIVEVADLRRIRDENTEMTIAFAGGVFDIIHPGHIEFLRTVKSIADIAVIGVSSDARVQERKGPNRPINDEQARAIVIDSIRYVDFCLVVPAPTRVGAPVPTISVLQELRPDFFVTRDDRWNNYHESIERCGSELVLNHAPKIGATTYIINSILTSHS